MLSYTEGNTKKGWHDARKDARSSCGVAMLADRFNQLYGGEKGLLLLLLLLLLLNWVPWSVSLPSSFRGQLLWCRSVTHSLLAMVRRVAKARARARARAATVLALMKERLRPRARARAKAKEAVAVVEVSGRA